MFSTNTQLTTARAGLRSISRIDVDNRNTCFQGFVFDKALKLGKCPGVGYQLLLSLNTNPISDMLQVFKDKHIARDTVGNNSFGYTVVLIGHPALFFAREKFQSAFGTFRSFALKTLAKVGIMFANMHYLSARKGLPLAGCSDIVKPSINTNRVATRRNNNFLLQHYIDIEDFLTSVVRQRSCFGLLPFEKSKLEIAHSKLDMLPAIVGRDADFLLLLDIAESPGIKRHAGWLELLWWTFAFKGSGYSGDCANNMISLQLVFLFQFMIAKTMQLISIGDFVFFGYGKNIIAAVSETFKRFLQDCGKLAIYLKFAFNCLYKFHAVYNITLLNACQ